MTREETGADVVAVDGVVELVLPETPSTGYRWVVEDQRLEVVDSRYDDPPRGAPGDPGTRTVRVRVGDAETAAVVLALRRPWEAQALARRTFSVRPNVS